MLDKILSGIGAFKQRLPQAQDALPGRDTPMAIHNAHFVHGRQLQGDFTGLSHIQFGMGCFWGVERLFWTIPGVVTTAVGYSGGTTPNPTYREVCSGLTGHTEAVLVVFDPAVCSLDTLLQTFWENHDPTQGMRQGNDVGTQYRSAIYWTSPEQKQRAEASRAMYQQALNAAGGGEITTEMRDAPEFYYAEDYHQQYLAKNPNGYCGLGGTGVSCPVPAAG
ncbi:peptide-methionine (S)-S-oxide reductase MsrA [Undibacterium sp.]|uniref:peptide-methionine (S)-S-oxide reductase MsrA n=1 Tax=Undibacterium sp. TaxID=1914977 RepID=UPI002C9D572A|nr:peptide-methionine (S)-S-oxide reductase MsrA [Undibacterium sp.]HTD02504.1 peptide-methionine (S)-S-oxide reductase MsrA [Undibacterium sp.]